MTDRSPPPIGCSTSPIATSFSQRLSDMAQNNSDSVHLSTIRHRRDTMSQSEMGGNKFKYDDDDVSLDLFLQLPARAPACVALHRNTRRIRYRARCYSPRRLAPKYYCDHPYTSLTLYLYYWGIHRSSTALMKLSGLWHPQAGGHSKATSTPKATDSRHSRSMYISFLHLDANRTQ